MNAGANEKIMQIITWDAFNAQALNITASGGYVTQKIRAAKEIIFAAMRNGLLKSREFNTEPFSALHSNEWIS